MTTTLMTSTGAVPPDAASTRVGGVPLAPQGFAWPECSQGHGPMRFLTHLALDGAPAVLSAFMCATRGCETWTAFNGTNLAAVLPADGLAPVPAPSGGTTALDGVAGVEPVTVGTDDYNDAIAEWADAEHREHTDVLGKIGGTPKWLQADQTPKCPGCTEPMTFVAQLENRLGMGLDSGCAYAFACWSCREGGLLWQS